MKEGAWISSATGHHLWVHDHAVWVTRPGNPLKLGVSDEVQDRLISFRSPHTPADRREVLLLAMGAGLIRSRGHGATTTFEATLPIITTLEVVMPFLRRHLGPWMTCRFNRLDTGESWVERVGVILPSEGSPTVLPHLIRGLEPIQGEEPGGEA